MEKEEKEIVNLVLQLLEEEKKEKTPEERLRDALLDKDSAIKKVCSGYLRDAEEIGEKVKRLKDAAGIASFLSEEETKRNKGLYQEAKSKIMETMELISDKDFNEKIKGKLSELDKIFEEKKDG